eukprot:TRINITY_DN3941_c1_g2_i1.p1 TRINITY_DN3941_c1_g2~~TRINITY_DN3941_c1_g2_i1.p1  ORF type:complete len:393 (-),score=59.60 TRINITY_DN3941_c1_g2_i1:279-1421(-)
MASAGPSKVGHHNAPDESNIAVLMNEAVYYSNPWEKLKQHWNRLQGKDENYAGPPGGGWIPLSDYITPYNDPELAEYEKTHVFMVGKRTGRETVLIFAFRGTSVHSKRDVKNDLSLHAYSWEVLDPLKGVWTEPNDKDFRVHRGFLKRAWGTTDKRKGHLVEFPRHVVVDGILRKGWTVIFSGHSLGGAVAGLITLGVIADYMRAKNVDANQIYEKRPRALGVRDEIKKRIKCITFGQPNFSQDGVRKSIQYLQLCGVFTHFCHHGDFVHNTFETVARVFDKTFFQKVLPHQVSDAVPLYTLVGESIQLKDNKEAPEYALDAFGQDGQRRCSPFMTVRMFESHFMKDYILDVFTYMKKRQGYSLPFVKDESRRQWLPFVK